MVFLMLLITCGSIVLYIFVNESLMMGLFSDELFIINEHAAGVLP